MKRRNNSTQRGFSLLTVTLLLAVVTISALLVIDQLTDDQDLQRHEKRMRIVREGAEGAMTETLSDHRFVGLLPVPADASLEASYTPDAQSVFQKEGQTYESKVRLLRIVPVMESSQRRVRAVVYEVDATADQSKHKKHIQTQIFKIAATQQGTVATQRHAR